MRQRLHITHILALLGCVCLALLLNLRSAETAPAEVSLGSLESALTAQKQHVPEAALTVAAQPCRICSSRPQRIVSSRGSGSGRSSGSSGSVARRQNVSLFQSPYDGRRRLESAPFCSPASRQYYVIALRHILC